MGEWGLAKLLSIVHSQNFKNKNLQVGKAIGIFFVFLSCLAHQNS
jgi:hypothetical protein